jgi:hypothetical protein
MLRDVPPRPDLASQPSVDETPVKPPQKKKRVLTQKQLEALELGRIKRREAQLAKSLAKKTEMEQKQQRAMENNGGVEEQKECKDMVEETPTERRRKPCLSLTLEEKLDALIEKEMKKSMKQSSSDEDKDEEEEEEEEEEFKSLTEDSEDSEEVVTEPIPRAPRKEKKKSTCYHYTQLWKNSKGKLLSTDVIWVDLISLFLYVFYVYKMYFLMY